MMSILRATDSKASDMKKVLALLFVVLMMTMAYQTSGAYAVAVPKVTVDPSCNTVKDTQEAWVKGTVSKAKGQVVALYAGDGETVLQEVTLPDSGGSAPFQMTIPDTIVSRPGKTTVYVKSLQAKGVSASKAVEVTIRAMKSQRITAPSKVTLTNLRTTSKLKAKSSSKLALSYKSSNPKVVSVNASGKLTRKKNGKATITITQKGNGTYLAAKKKVTVTSRKSTKKEQIDGAVAWAVKIAKDNSFAYGTGSGAHHFGCYFCGTNYGPKKYMKPSKKYKKTYCCNPFISAAYAHGAQHPKMLAACKRASGIGMSKDTFYRYGCWKCIGHPSYEKLQKGDVLVKSTHVAMYIGKGKMVEASGGSWSAGSIATKKMSGSRYNGFSFVMRYTGY